MLQIIKTLSNLLSEIKLNAEKKKESFALIIVKLEGNFVQPQEWPERGLNYTFIC